MARAVVKFLLTQEVSVVPVTWIRGNMCLWPPKKMQSQLSSCIEKDIPVTASDAWDAFPIELMGIYGNLVSFFSSALIFYKITVGGH